MTAPQIPKGLLNAANTAPASNNSRTDWLLGKITIKTQKRRTRPKRRTPIAPPTSRMLPIIRWVISFPKLIARKPLIGFSL
jgi:hypothetical protein